MQGDADLRGERDTDGLAASSQDFLGPTPRSAPISVSSWRRFFTGLFVIGWIQARKRQADAHHWLMLGGMVAMLGFFISYYLFRQLGVLAFEGKEGFGGSEALYHYVFIPLLTFHIILVIIGLVMAVYMIVLGFRAQMIEQGRRIAERAHPSDDLGKDRHDLRCPLALVAVYLLYLVAADRFRWDGLWCGSDFSP